ncbi:PQQ-binding-like beta-propeller repeat protein [Rhodococcus ruber]|uniref:PQQ-binding-like beta-propeller repeat protein n=1 Tax=Rhodococcus ruber TaxID=1830 RepID=A0ABT4MI59_9NOCA|nr:PQQ-binding-like beta-propeller repeat protein [Rhodococcus ruber]MCZ4520671.1 PQQ-binding-like beta-propeller repeat protein [Rhodococcus ruber]
MSACSADVEEPPARDLRIASGGLASRPSSVWTVDTANVGDSEHRSAFYLPSVPGDDAPILVGAATGGYGVGDVGVVVAALDPSSATQLWRADLGVVRQCAETIDDVVLACYGDDRVVYLDVTNGSILGDLDPDPDFPVYHVRVAAGVAYVSTRSADMFSARLWSGTFTDPGRYWRRDAATPVLGVPVSPAVLPDIGVATLYAQGTYSILDIDSGADRFTFSGESLMALRHDLFLQSIRNADGSRTERLLDGVGSVRTTIEVPTYGHSFDYPVSKRDNEIPLFLGDGAYDSETARELWRNPHMLEYEVSGAITAVLAVVGNTVIVGSSTDRTLSGIDLETGVTRWVTPWQDAYWAKAGATDGEHYVFGDYTGMHGIRASDGVVLWSVPWPDGTDPRVVSVAETAGVLSISGPDGVTLWH